MSRCSVSPHYASYREHRCAIQPRTRVRAHFELKYEPRAMILNSLAITYTYVGTVHFAIIVVYRMELGMEIRLPLAVYFAKWRAAAAAGAGCTRVAVNGRSADIAIIEHICLLRLR